MSEGDAIPEASLEATEHETALRHGAGVQQKTSDPGMAYAPYSTRVPGPFREEWLP